MIPANLIAMQSDTFALVRSVRGRSTTYSKSIQLGYAIRKCIHPAPRRRPQHCKADSTGVGQEVLDPSNMVDLKFALVDQPPLARSGCAAFGQIQLFLSGTKTQRSSWDDSLILYSRNRLVSDISQSRTESLPEADEGLVQTETF